jgi:hypothetical protein
VVLHVFKVCPYCLAGDMDKPYAMTSHLAIGSIQRLVTDGMILLHLGISRTCLDQAHTEPLQYGHHFAACTIGDAPLFLQVVLPAQRQKLHDTGRDTGGGATDGDQQVRSGSKFGHVLQK